MNFLQFHIKPFKKKMFISFQHGSAAHIRSLGSIHDAFLRLLPLGITVENPQAEQREGGS